MNLEKLWVEVQAVMRESADGMTAVELAAHWDVGLSVVRLRLRKLIDAGKVHCAGRRWSETIDGRPVRVPVYQVSDLTKEAKR